MSNAEVIAMLPLLIAALAASVLTGLAGFYRPHRFVAGFTMAALLLSFASLFLAADVAPRQVTGLIAVDDFSIFAMGLIFAASFAITLISYGYNGGRQGRHTEYYILLLLSTLGAAVLSCSRHFASFFLGLETLSVSLFGLVAYMRTPRGSEAGLKYLVLAGASSAFLVFGMALVYAGTGTMEFSGVRMAGTGGAMLGAGMAMITAGAGFKLAVVPFHAWTPDVYEGSPAPVSAFIASVSKGAVVVALLRLFTAAGAPGGGPLFIFLSAVAIASMFAGNLLALFQDNIKRLLAYSSIAHLGYLLVAFLSAGTFAASAVMFYLAAYFASMVGAFGVVTVMSGSGKDAEGLDVYRGLAWRRPWLAAVFTAMLLSLAGIPLTAGFVGKFYLIAAGTASSLWALVISLALSSVIGFYFYLRVIMVLFATPHPEDELYPRAIDPIGGAALIALTFVLVLLGVYPAPFLGLVGAASVGIAP